MKGLYIYTCKSVLDFTLQGMWAARVRAIWFAEIGVIGSQHPGDFLSHLYFFVGMNFHTKKQINYVLAVLNCNRYLITPPQVHHDITCCHY